MDGGTHISIEECSAGRQFPGVSEELKIIDFQN